MRAGIDIDLTPLQHRPVCVAYSGGLDSSVLLHRLAAEATVRAQGLRAVHVHHGLQADADAWAAHCREVCEALGIALQVVHARVDVDGGHGPENAARIARHAAFAEVLQPGDVLALGHHRDDQAETFVLRALRGSGVEGLAAMRPWRAHGEGWWWRPLLGIARAQLHAYARTHGLDWIDDPSNTASDMDRNFLRLQVLPLLRQRWPHAHAALARSAHLAAEASDLLLHTDHALLRHAQGEPGDRLHIDTLRALDGTQRARVLRAWIGGLHLPPLPARGVANIEHALLGDAADGAQFAWHGAWIRRWRDHLYAGRDDDPMDPQWQVVWDGREPVPLPDGGAVALVGADGFDAPLQLRLRRGGERITLQSRRHSHALKHVLQQVGVPPWQRLRLPLLCDAHGAVLAAGDVVVSATLQDWLQRHRARLRWIQP